MDEHAGDYGTPQWLAYLCSYTREVLRQVVEVGAPEGWRINIHHDSTVFVSSVAEWPGEARSVGLRMFYVLDTPLWRWQGHMRPEGILRSDVWHSFGEALDAILPLLAVSDLRLAEPFPGEHSGSSAAPASPPEGAPT